jgi:hypothetical protein
MACALIMGEVLALSSIMPGLVQGGGGGGPLEGGCLFAARGLGKGKCLECVLS